MTATFGDKDHAQQAVKALLEHAMDDDVREGIPRFRICQPRLTARAFEPGVAGDQGTTCQLVSVGLFSSGPGR